MKPRTPLIRRRGPPQPLITRLPPTRPRAAIDMAAPKSASDANSSISGKINTFTNDSSRAMAPMNSTRASSPGLVFR